MLCIERQLPDVVRFLERHDTALEPALWRWLQLFSLSFESFKLWSQGKQFTNYKSLSFLNIYLAGRFSYQYRSDELAKRVFLFDILCHTW